MIRKKLFFLKQIQILNIITTTIILIVIVIIVILIIVIVILTIYFNFSNQAKYQI